MDAEFTIVRPKKRGPVIAAKAAVVLAITLLYSKLYLALGWEYGSAQELAQRRWTWVIAAAAAAIYLLLFDRRCPSPPLHSSRERVWLAVLTVVLALHLLTAWFGQRVVELWNPTFYLAALIDSNNWTEGFFYLLARPFLGERNAGELGRYQWNVIQQLLLFAILLGWVRLVRRQFFGGAGKDHRKGQGEIRLKKTAF